MTGPSLFDASTLAGSLSAAPMAAPGEEALDAGFFLDMDAWHAAHPKVSIPPDPATYSREALSQHAGMEWLAGVDTILIYPNSPDPEAQRLQLVEFQRQLRAEAMVIGQGFCPAFPAGYSEPLLALDTETTGLDVRVRYDKKGRLLTRTLLVGLCIAVSDTKGYYLPVRHTEQDGVPNWDPAVIAWFIGELQEAFACIWHNSTYDREVCALNGVQKFRPWPYFFDTQICDFFHDVNQKVHGLKPASVRHLNRKMLEIQELMHGLGAKKSKDNFIFFDTIAATTAVVYGCSDAMNTYGLFKFYAAAQVNNIFQEQQIPLEVDHKMVDVMRRMCRPGVPINFRYFYYAAMDAIFRAKRTEAFIYRLIGRQIELNSPKQLSELLFVELRIPPVDENGNPAKPGANGSYSTAEDVLYKLDELYPDVLILKYIVLWRKINSSIAKAYTKALVNGYTDAVLPYTKIQPAFSQTNVPTGRLSSSSSDGAERLTLKITGKSQKKSWSYRSGSWDAGMNMQGIANPSFRKLKAKRIRKLPAEAGIEFSELYPSWVKEAFRQALAEV